MSTGCKISNTEVVSRLTAGSGSSLSNNEPTSSTTESHSPDGRCDGCGTCSLLKIIDSSAGCLSCMGGSSIIEDLKYKPEEGLTTQKISDILDIVKVSDKKTVIFGSYVYSPQLYPGDIDMRSIVAGCCTEDVVYRKIRKILQDVPKKLKGSRGSYFGEVKAGYDLRFKLDVKSPDFMERVDKLHKSQLMEASERKMIRDLIGKNTDESLTIAQETIRMLYVLRWNQKEIVAGVKKMRGGKKITLLDALRQKTPVKSEIYAIVNGRYMEVSNFYYLAIYDKATQSFRVLNIGDCQLQSTYIDQMKKEVRKLSSPPFENLYKMSKRMWLIGRSTKDRRLLTALTPLFQGNTARISQIASDISTLILVLTEIKNPPRTSIIDQIDNIKTRISYATDIGLDFTMVYKLIDSILSENDGSKRFNDDTRKGTIKTLKKLYEYLKSVIRVQTIDFLKQVRLYPVPQWIYSINDVSGKEIDYVGDMYTKMTGNPVDKSVCLLTKKSKNADKIMTLIKELSDDEVLSILSKLSH